MAGVGWVLAMGVLGGASLSDAQLAELSGEVDDLVTRALAGGRAEVRLAVVDGPLAIDDVVVARELEPVYVAIRALLDADRRVKLIGARSVTSAAVRVRGKGIFDLETLLALGKAVRADAVLYLPGRLRHPDVVVTAEWIDVEAGKPVAAARIEVGHAAAGGGQDDSDDEDHEHHRGPVVHDDGCVAACERQGLCTERAGACVATSDADCRASALCSLGQCSARGGECIAAIDADCAETAMCRTAGRCVAAEGRCMTHEEVAAARPGVQAESDEPVRPRRSVGLMVTGLVSTGVGVLGLAVGGFLLLVANDTGARSCTVDERGEQQCRPLTEAERAGLRDGGAGVMIAGGIVTAGGIALAIFGGIRVSPDGSGRDSAAIPEVRIGPRSVRLAWTW